MLDQRLAEGHAHAGIGERRIEGSAGDAHGLRRHADPPAVERRQRDLEAGAGRAQHGLGRHVEPVEHDLAGVAGTVAELLLQPRHAIARAVGARQEAGDAVLAGTCVGDGEDHRQLRRLARGDEVLHSVDHVAVALPHGARREVGGVGADLRLAQQEGGELAARRGGAQEFFLLGIRAVAPGWRRCRESWSPPSCWRRRHRRRRSPPSPATYDTKSAPDPPHCGGTQTPIRPSAPILPNVSSGTCSRRSQSAANGVISRRAKSRATSRMMVCCSLNMRAEHGHNNVLASSAGRCQPFHQWPQKPRSRRKR